MCPPAGFPPDPCRTVGAVINRPGDSAGVPAGQCAPHSLFGCAKKRTRRARCKRKRRRARSGAVALRAYGGRRTSACSDLALPSGTLCSSAISPTAVPWRMVRKLSGCKNAFDQLLFPRVPLRYALPWRSWKLQLGPMLKLSLTTGQRQRKSAQRVSRTSPGWRGSQGPDVSLSDRRKGSPTFPPPKHVFFSAGSSIPHSPCSEVHICPLKKSSS